MKAEHLTESATLNPLDDPRQWASNGIWNPPSFDVRAYQTRIDRIVGKSDGKPIVRLIWAWHSRKWVNDQWDSFGMATHGEWRAKYRFMTVKFGEDTTDISPPRWILEERFEPGQYMPSWNQSRWVYDPILGRNKDIGGMPPQDGWYGYLTVIATHDKNKACCERAWQSDRRVCWGYHKTPGETELNALRRAVWERNKDPQKVSPHEPLPQEVVDELGRKAFEEAEVDATEQQDEIGERIKNELDVWGWRLTETDPTKLSHGRYHDLAKNFKRQENTGILVPNTL